MLIIPDRERIEESLALSREYGLGFEYNDFCTGMDDIKAIDDLVTLFLRHKPACSCTVHGAFYDIAVGSVDGQIRAISRQRVWQSVEICKKLGAQAVVFHTNTIPNLNLPAYCDLWLEENTRFFASVLAANPGIDLYIENMFDFTPDLLCRLADRLASHPNFGVCLDFAHACLSPTPIGRWMEALAPYIRHCHLNDCDGRGDTHWPLGRGVLDIPGFFRLLEKHQAKCTLLLEIGGIENQRESLEYLKTRGLMDHPFLNTVN